MSTQQESNTQSNKQESGKVFIKYNSIEGSHRQEMLDNIVKYGFDKLTWVATEKGLSSNMQHLIFVSSWVKFWNIHREWHNNKMCKTDWIHFTHRTFF